MAISSPGVGSGLDINGIVSKLMQVESQPLDNLKTQQASFNATLSGYGTLKSSVSSFQTALQGLSSSSFGAQKATVSDASILSASADNTATPGVYAVQVTQLAQQQKLTSAGFASTTTSLGSGALTVGGNSPVTITPNSYTLQGIRDALNATNTGVNATIVNDGSANGYRLVITAKDSGASNQISITASDPSLSQFNNDPANQAVFDPANPNAQAGMSQLQAAADAKLTIDGIAVTKASNTITDAIQGVTLNLVKINTGNTVNVAVARDSDTIKASVANFVKAFNDLNKTVRAMTAYDPTTKVGGALQGDSGALSVLSQVRGVLIKAVTGTTTLTSLTDIGVSFQRDGTLAVDNTKLQKAVDNNFDDISKLFSSSTGYATQLTALTTTMLGDDGLLTTRTNGLNASIKNIISRQDSMQARLDQIEANYRAQFTRLDVTIASMQNTSSFLTQQLAGLAANTNSK